MAGLSSENTEGLLRRQLISGGKSKGFQYVLFKEFTNDPNFCIKLKQGPELLLFHIFDRKIRSIKTIKWQKEGYQDHKHFCHAMKLRQTVTTVAADHLECTK